MKALIQRFFERNELERLLLKAAKKKKKKFLIFWNRGLGDIALGMYALVYKIREHVPEAEISFVTRTDLVEGFRLIENVQIIENKYLKRGEKFSPKIHMPSSSYDVILEAPNPTKWLSWQIGNLTPRLAWNSEWDNLWKKFQFDTSGLYIGVHVNSETVYGYEKNWSSSKWKELFEKLTEHGYKIVLFGHKKDADYKVDGVFDLRGETTLMELLSIIKNRCGFLIAPDAGVLCLTYYLDVSFPIKVVSLWADPRQGILKQKVPSPNIGLQHFPILGKDELIANISPQQVLEKIIG